MLMVFDWLFFTRLDIYIAHLHIPFEFVKSKPSQPRNCNCVITPTIGIYVVLPLPHTTIMSVAKHQHIKALLMLVPIEIP